MLLVDETRRYGILFRKVFDSKRLTGRYGPPSWGNAWQLYPYPFPAYATSEAAVAVVQNTRNKTNYDWRVVDLVEMTVVQTWCATAFPLVSSRAN